MQLAALALGFFADLLFGDPLGACHIVVGIGRLITLLERAFRRILPATPVGETAGGVLLVTAVCAVAYGVPYLLLRLLLCVHPLLALIAEAFLCWQCLAMRDLKVESMAVYTCLRRGDLPAARKAVGCIVGRDVDALSPSEVARAAAETVAENANDGVIAPMLFLAVSGAPLGVLYKAINTMDSMLGYRNERYRHFGCAAARLDDAAGFLPARIAALLMIAVCPLLRLDTRNAWRVFYRDRYRHSSPNAGQTEAACAGALGVRFGGGAYYGGRYVEKPVIGGTRDAEADDIPRANRLLYGAGGLGFLLCVLVRGGVLWLSLRMAAM